jgi:methyl-accepting chemotaxis protein
VLGAFGWFIADLFTKQIHERAAGEATEESTALLDALKIVDSLASQNVQTTMKILMEEGKRIGAPQSGGNATIANVAVPDLLLGGSSQVGHFEFVDRIKAISGNAATLFVRRGEDYVRVSTNVLKADGSRAIGTLLDAKGPAYAAIQQGKSFYGVADILDAPYMTAYEPMRDASGRTIGIWFAGTPLTALTELGRQISAAKILDNGYVALSKRDGTVVFRPDRIPEKEIKDRITTARVDGWTVRNESFDKWGYTVQAAYPESDVSGKVWKARWPVIICTIVILIFIVVSEDLLLARLVLRPIQDLVTRMERADVHTSLNTTRNDEIGTLAKTFDHFVENIRKSLLQVAGASAQLADSSEKLTLNSNQLTSSAAETSEQVHLISSAATTVSDNLQSVATAAEELNVTVKEIAKNANDAARVASEAVNATQKTNATVAKLGESSAQIGDVIKVITSIARQTNLLALNATIEAARAGEAGKGFAVVAHEVKELAKQTGAATEEISRKILVIQEDSSDTAKALAAIGEIIHSIDSISTVIASAVEEQSATVNEISRNVSDAVGGSERIAQNISGVDSTAEHTSTNARGSQECALQLSNLSGELKTLVGRFHLDAKN